MKLARFLSFIVVLAIFVTANSAVRADIITLIDGTEHEGEVLRENTESITLRVRVGTNVGSIQIPRREIVSIQAKSVASDTVLAEGVGLQKKADALEKEPKKAAEAWVKVADFYQSHPGYSNLARAAYIKTLTYDPDNARARTKLGYEKTQNGWVAIEKPKPQEEPAAAGVKAEPENELIIGLRRDEALIQRILDNQAERQRQGAEVQRREVREADDRPPFTAYGYSRDVIYIGPYGNTYYLPSGSMIGYSGNYFGGYGGYGYGGYSGYGSGLNVGFRGRFGNVQVNGTYGGGHYSGGGFGGSGGTGFRGRFGF
jgi:hypothetical protein